MSAAGSYTAADMSLNANFRATAGNTSTGASGFDVDISTKATTATLPLKLVGVPNRPDNVVGDSFLNVYVMINNHQLKGTGVLGV